MRFADTTRGGQPVRILCTDRRGTLFPILALVGDGDYLTTYTSEGRYVASGEESWMDLIPLTPKVGRIYNEGHYKVLIHDPDLNPSHPWAVVALGDNYLFWVDDCGVSESGFIKLDL